MSFWKKKSENEESPELAGIESPSSTSAPVGAPTSGPSVVAAKPFLGGGAPSLSPAILPGGSLKPEDVLTERFGKARSALGEGTVIQGKLSFDTPVRIDGKLSGEIFSSKVLIVGPSGHIDASIEAASLVILGSVKGTISASERVELWSGASLEGVVTTPVLVIQDGSSFIGTSHMLASQAGYAAEPQGQPSRKGAGADSQAKSSATIQAKSEATKPESAKSESVAKAQATSAASPSKGANSGDRAEVKKDAHVH